MHNIVLKTENISKTYDNIEVLKKTSISVKKGEALVIIGSSGSGKTTLLRCLNRLVEPTSGIVYFNGINIVDSKVNINKYRQKIGMVFQSFNLFNHKTVMQNLIFAPVKILKNKKEDMIKKALLLLKKINMEGFENKRVEVLSGGQKQRIAIARALMMDPEIMLFDEPTSALDSEMVGEVVKVIQELKKDNMTMVIVTHELDFCKKIASRVMFMQDGYIIEENSVDQIFDNPKTPNLISFLKNYNS